MKKKIPDFTLVVGVDRKHLRQLSYTWPTWVYHKPSLLDHPMVVFYDRLEVSEEAIRQTVKQHPHLTLVPWPLHNVEYRGDPNSKWFHPQRYKMLAGFVHVPGRVVSTPYWLKLDTDIVATGNDQWIDPNWFQREPSAVIGGPREAKPPGIIAQSWGLTKPPNQVLELDAWVERNSDQLRMLASEPPLDLRPEPGADKLKHPRIISWCGFFDTVLTRLASQFAEQTCGKGLLPVPSQDGYLWYVAARLGHQIVRTKMKDKGWAWQSAEKNILSAVQQAMFV